MSLNPLRLLLCLALGAMVARAGTISVVFSDNRFGTIDSSSGAYTQISTIPLGEAAGVAAGLTSLYVEDIYSNLLSIDPYTGIATMVGNSGLGLTVPVFGGGADGLFELDTASNLYSISTSTGKATLIGATGLPANNFNYDTSLSSDGHFLYYTAGAPGGLDELYRINTANGKAKDLGSTGLTGIAGSALVDGYLDLFQYGQQANYIYSAEEGSTLFTRGAVLATQIVDGGAVISGSSVQSAQVVAATPEPTTLILGLPGLLMIVIGLKASRRN